MSTVPDRRSIDLDSFDYILEQDVSVPLRCQSGTVRANVYRPKSTSETRFPVLITYGPYGKDVPYSRCDLPTMTVLKVGLRADNIGQGSIQTHSRNSTKNKNRHIRHGRLQIQASGPDTATP